MGEANLKCVVSVKPPFEMVEIDFLKVMIIYLIGVDSAFLEIFKDEGLDFVFEFGGEALELLFTRNSNILL